MFEEIDAAFAVAGKPVIFTFGDTIFNPEGIEIGKSLVVHEGVHAERQGDVPGDWWRRYIAEPEFRLAEEIPAHRAEWAAIKSVHRDPNRQIRHLVAIAGRLSGPLYGGLISFQEAVRAIR
jgi:hypothetical protein